MMSDRVKPEFVYALRTCRADMTSRGGFRWPESGPVECPDWNPEAVCGGGLHGVPFGVGDLTELAEHGPFSKWLVVQVPRGAWVEFDRKCKFPRCEVIYCGPMAGALAIIAEMRSIELFAETVSTTGGGSHAATTGGGSHATTTGVYAHAATTGKHATACCLGLRGRARCGSDGSIILSYLDSNSRHRHLVAYAGENGIEAGVWYEVSGGALARCEDQSGNTRRDHS